jgi:hypothetical protein
MTCPRNFHGVRALHVLFAVFVALLCAAPVPGDIGGCGQEPDLLDGPVFFLTKQQIDCERCQKCGLIAQSCRRACEAKQPVPDDFPEGCSPLVHDGEVCLRALLHASCAEYETYVDEQRPQVPTECNFCPPRS